MTLNIYDVLKELTESPAVTGNEEQRRKLIIKYFANFCDVVSVDFIGNVIGSIGTCDRSVMISGHYDQLGFIIKHIDERGYAYFSPVGGWDPRVAYGERVKVWIGSNPENFLIGVIGTKPPQVTEARERDAVVGFNDMRIDFGASSRETAEKMGVHSGTMCTPATLMDHVGAKGSDFVIGPALDDVSAVVSVIKTLEKLKENPPRGLKVYAVATVQEEIGSRGAHVAGYNLNPTYTINSDTTSAIAPGVDISRVGDVKLGNGPAIAFGPCFSKELCQLMEEEAKLNNIPYQRRVVPDRSGNDSWELQVAKGGSICGLLSMPSKYMHSANEVVSLNDVKNVGELFYYTIKSLEKNDIKHTTELFRRNE